MDSVRNLNVGGLQPELMSLSPSSIDSGSSTGLNRRASDPERDQESDRPYDLVIFGASSSVGRFIVEEMALVVEKFYMTQQRSPIMNHNSNSLFTKDHLESGQQFSQHRRLSVPRPMDGIQWAIAGRSAIKLNETLCRAELSTGIKDLSYRIPVILADLNHTKSLQDMCQKTKLLINCVGPYSSYGEEIIKVCIATKTNYIDLCHETTFIDEIRRKYTEVARSSGIFIINGCGFQSMSAEMGFNFVKQVVDGQVDEVKVILSLNDTKALVRPSNSNLFPTGIVSSGMWCSMLDEKAQQVSLNDRFRDPDLTQPRGSIDLSVNGESSKMRRDTQTMVRDIVEFKNRNTLPWLNMVIGFNSNGRGYCWPLKDLTSEESQMIRGEMDYYETQRPDMESSSGWRPIRCSTFVAMHNMTEVIFILLWTIAFSVLSKFGISRWIMRNYSYVFSLGNVCNHNIDRDSLTHIKYSQTFIAYGTPGDSSGDPLDRVPRRKQVQLLVARVVGPEPNHVATATFVVQAALALSSEPDHLPTSGGVMTPGAAFADTNIIYQLRRRNIKFEVLKKA